MYNRRNETRSKLQIAIKIDEERGGHAGGVLSLAATVDLDYGFTASYGSRGLYILVAATVPLVPIPPPSPAHLMALSKVYSDHSPRIISLTRFQHVNPDRLLQESKAS